jgi:hypothetical protein
VSHVGQRRGILSRKAYVCARLETVGGCCSISRRAAVSHSGQRRGALSRRAEMLAPSNDGRLLLISPLWAAKR